MSNGARVNALGLDRDAYTGNPSSLCKGCGHESIANQIISVAFELALDPHRVIKLSGIGCSSKSPAYFVSRGYGFNGLHGRMPSLATGALIVNQELIGIGVSGDGDTGSIGLGQFKHTVRRNVPMVYIVENNGVYGLTKGQFSATADKGQVLKYSGVNDLPPIDICIEALVANATFVARSFAGNSKQVRELLKAAITHQGLAVLDIISPCVTFNNREDSTKSYQYGKTNQQKLHEITFVPCSEEDGVEYDAEQGRLVELHGGAHLLLKRLGPTDYDPTDRVAAYRLLEQAREEQTLATGLIYIDSRRPSMTEDSHLVDTPLVKLSEKQLRPPRVALDQMMEQLS